MNVMLAANADMDKIKYPCVVQPKIDGIRCHIELVNDKVVALSRTNKPIPNIHVQQVLAKTQFLGLDGELVIGHPTNKDVFKKTTSVVMSEDKPIDDLHFIVFDYTVKDTPYYERYDKCKAIQLDYYNRLITKWIDVVTYMLCETKEELLTLERSYLQQGYEGIIIRDPESTYKEGRSTIKEGKLLKVKRFSDSEAVIINYDRLMTNNNALVINELGYTSRSTKKEGLVPKETLGTLHVVWNNKVFCIGSGFTAKERDELWSLGNKLLGKYVKFKYFKIGMDELPRFPIFLGLRDEIDFS